MGKSRVGIHPSNHSMLNRLIALLLVPCLIADPVTACTLGGFIPARGFSSFSENRFEENALHLISPFYKNIHSHDQEGHLISPSRLLETDDRRHIRRRSNGQFDFVLGGNTADAKETILTNKDLRLAAQAGELTSKMYFSVV